jgi:plasmid maintenance system killer protein
MIYILPASPRVLGILKKHALTKKWQKQLLLLASNPRHPSLHVELLEPKDKGIYSFRIDRKFRAIFIYRTDVSSIEIITVTVHYK